MSYDAYQFNCLISSDDVVDFSEEFKHFTAEIKRRSQNKEQGVIFDEI